MLDRAAANAPTTRDAFHARAAYHRGHVYSPHHRAQVERAERAARAYDGLDKLRATFDHTAPPIPKAPEVAEAAAVASANDAARDYWQAERDQARGRPGRFGRA